MEKCDEDDEKGDARRKVGVGNGKRTRRRSGNVTTDFCLERDEMRTLERYKIRAHGQLLHFPSSFHPSFSFTPFLPLFFFLCGSTTALDSQNFFYSPLKDAIDHLYVPECSKARV